VSTFASVQGLRFAVAAWKRGSVQVITQTDVPDRDKRLGVVGFRRCCLCHRLPRLRPGFYKCSIPSLESPRATDLYRRVVSLPAIVRWLIAATNIELGTPRLGEPRGD
jgi:hypothetical protein